MAVIDEIRISYANFEAGVNNARRSESGFKQAIEGLFAGKNLVDPFFESFYSEMTKLLSEYDPAKDDASEIIRLIVERSIEKKDDPKLGICYTAVFGPAKALAKTVNGEKAGELFDLIDSSFKNYECLPVMLELKKILKKNSK